MAGINAALQVKAEPPLILDRTEAYTAILIDDLISKARTSLTGCLLRGQNSVCTCASTTPIAGSRPMAAAWA